MVEMGTFVFCKKELWSQGNLLLGDLPWKLFIIEDSNFLCKLPYQPFK